MAVYTRFTLIRRIISSRKDSSVIATGYCEDVILPYHENASTARGGLVAASTTADPCELFGKYTAEIINQHQLFVR